MMENMSGKVDREVSFRGNPIPEINPKSNYQITDSDKIVSKIKGMSRDQQKSVTLEGVHYGDWGISEVKLSTGDVVTIETAIALAENHMLNGYTTGATFKGGKVLRSMPTQADSTISRVHDLPTF